MAEFITFISGPGGMCGQASREFITGHAED